MSSGLWHNRATIGATLLASGVSLIINPTITPFILIGGLLGVPLSPDVDQPTLNRFEGQLLKSSFPLFKLFGYLHITLFAPYSRMFGHRSFWTHTPVIGTIGRLIYIGLFIGTIRLLALPIDYVMLLWQQNELNYQYLLAIIGMLILVDTIHWFMDYVIQIK